MTSGERNLNPDQPVQAQPDPQQVPALLRDIEATLRLPQNRNPAAMADFLTDDFVEIGVSGRALCKQQVLELVQQQVPVPMTVTDFEARALGPAVYLVTYRVQRHAEPPTQSLRSSIWTYGAAGWRMAFHQGTVVPQL